MGSARRLVALALLLRQTRATTLAGVVFEHGVVLGADSRATTGSIIADSSCDKLHPLCGNCWAGGCGTAADADELTRHVALDIRLRLRAATTAIAVFGGNGAPRGGSTASLFVRDDAIGVVRCAIEAGIACDTGSGGEVHLVVIEPGDAGRRAFSGRRTRGD
ncbi:threonine-type endopeptidase [Aureococcus anophagefferens]|nr:threonine-type endopeptidase [Aureococcus anophagefferens]